MSYINRNIEACRRATTAREIDRLTAQLFGATIIIGGALGALIAVGCWLIWG